MLSGAGTVSMSGESSLITDSGMGFALTNVNDKIVGTGALFLPNSIVANEGTIAALGSDVLQLTGDHIRNFTTKALILASGNGAQVQLDGNAGIAGGTLKTSVRR